MSRWQWPLDSKPTPSVAFGPCVSGDLHKQIYIYIYKIKNTSTHSSSAFCSLVGVTNLMTSLGNLLAVIMVRNLLVEAVQNKDVENKI